MLALQRARSRVVDDGVAVYVVERMLLRNTAPARTESGEAITAGQTVRIKRVVGTQFYVEAISSEVNLNRPI